MMALVDIEQGCLVVSCTADAHCTDCAVELEWFLLQGSGETFVDEDCCVALGGVEGFSYEAAVGGAVEFVSDVVV